MKSSSLGVTALPLLLAGLFSVCMPAPGAPEKAQNNDKGPAKSSGAKDACQQLLEWNVQTTLGAYDRCGHKSPKWDEPARVALRVFAELRSLSPNQRLQTNTAERNEALRQACVRAVAAGCDDPLIEYLNAKSLGAAEERAKAMVKAAHDLDGSQYPEIRKTYACLRAAGCLDDLVPATYVGPGHYRKVMTPEMREFYRLHLQHLLATLAEKDLPPGELYDICTDSVMPFKNNKENLEAFWSRVEGPLMKDRQGDATTLLVKGKVQTFLAWTYRGGGFANTVKDEQWKAFEEKLAGAEQTLAQAWKLDPKNPEIAVEMMRVELGQGQGRERLESWFKRAMDLDANNYNACEAKYYYLTPKWYGSEAELLGFGRECLNSSRWGGRVPLMLVSIHQSIVRDLPQEEQDAYWKRPAVWRDINAAYQRFFQLNPNAKDYLPGYVELAYQCEQWSKVNELVAKLGTVNYEDFGGKQAYQQMVSRARQRAGDGPP
jgi:hypothetical protein